MFSFRLSLLAKASAVAIVVSCLSAPVMADGVTDAVKAALNHHPSVAAARANRDALQQERSEKWSDFFPHLNVSATGGRTFANNSTSRGLNTVRGEGYSWLWEGGATVSQLLFDGFETSERVAAADARREAASYNIVDVREALALRAVVAYLDILRSQESLDMLLLHSGLIDDYVTRIEGMVDEGAADETMLVQAQDIRVQLEDTVVDMKGQLRTAGVNYEEVTGLKPDEMMTRPLPRLDLIYEDTAVAVDNAVRSHPMLLSSFMTEKALGHEAEAEKVALYPDFTGELSLLKRDLDDVIGGESKDAKAVVRMNWDYSIGGAQHARKRKALLRRVESKAQYDEQVRRIDQAVRISYSDRDVSQGQLAVAKKRIDLNERLLETNKAQFEAARVNLLQLLQTENALFNSRLGILNAGFRLMGSQYTVLAAMGQLQNSMDLVPTDVVVSSVKP